MPEGWPLPESLAFSFEKGEEALEMEIPLRLPEVRFLPAGTPPHRERPVAEARVRLERWRDDPATMHESVLGAPAARPARPSFLPWLVAGLVAAHLRRPPAAPLVFDQAVIASSWRATIGITRLQRSAPASGSVTAIRPPARPANMPEMTKAAMA